MLVLIAGGPGVGKSTVCERLRDRGHRAIDADWDGLNHWVHRSTGAVIVDPPYPVPAGWTADYAWRVDPDAVRGLVETSLNEVVFLAGSVENEVDVWDFFDRVICLVADDATVRTRVKTRTTNAYGQNPDELAIIMEQNSSLEETYRSFGAVIIDGTADLDDDVPQVLAASPGLR